MRFIGVFGRRGYCVAIFMALMVAGCRDCSGWDTGKLALYEAHYEDLSGASREGKDAAIAKAYGRLNHPEAVAGRFLPTDGDTNVVLLAKDLAKNGVEKVAVLPNNQGSRFLVQAFASYAAQGFAENDGLSVGAVYFVNSEEIVKTASLYAADLISVGRYFVQQLKLMHERAQANKGTSVFVVDAKHIPSSVSVVDVKAALDGSYLILLSDDVSSRLNDKGSLHVGKFTPQALKAQEIRNLSYFKMTALNDHEPSHINVEMASEYMAKILRGMIYHVDLADIDHLCEAVFALIKDKKAPTEKEHVNAVRTEVARRFNVTFASLDHAKLYKLDVDAVEKRVVKDPGCFLRKDFHDGKGEDPQKRQDNLRREVNAYATALGAALAGLEYDKKFREAKREVSFLQAEAYRYLNYAARLSHDGACLQNSAKRYADGFLGFGGTAAPRAYFRDYISAMPVGLDHEHNFESPSRMMTPLIQALDRSLNINASFHPEILKPIVLNCYLYGNGLAELTAKLNAIKTSIVDVKKTVDIAAEIMTKPVEASAMVSIVSDLVRHQSDIDWHLQETHGDFSGFDVTPADYFSSTALISARPFGQKAAANLIAYQRSGRRIYAYFLAHILGESPDHPSVPFSGVTELYQNGGIGAGLVGKYKNRAHELGLFERLVRSHIVKELQALITAYGQVIGAYIKLADDDRAQIEDETASDFSNLVVKMQRILRSQVLPTEIVNLNSSFFDVFAALKRDFIPDEITTMFHAHPINSPSVIMDAVNDLSSVFDAANDLVNVQRAENFLDSVVAQGSDYAMDVTLKDAYADQVVAMAALKARNAAHQWTAVNNDAALKTYRFVVGKNESMLDATPYKTDGKLKPIFDDLQKRMREIEIVVARIYFYVSFLQMK